MITVVIITTVIIIISPGFDFVNAVNLTGPPLLGRR